MLSDKKRRHHIDYCALVFVIGTLFCLGIVAKYYLTDTPENITSVRLITTFPRTTFLRLNKVPIFVYQCDESSCDLTSFLTNIGDSSYEDLANFVNGMHLEALLHTVDGVFITIDKQSIYLQNIDREVTLTSKSIRIVKEVYNHDEL
jgi:hypothetical protein